MTLFLYAVLEHLWQSTLFALAAGLLTLALSKNRASVRYSMWFAASVKFLIPFSLLVSFGRHIGWPSAPEHALLQLSFAVPFRSASVALSTPLSAVSNDSVFPLLLLAAWGCGFISVLLFWAFRWSRLNVVVRNSQPCCEARVLEALDRVQKRSRLQSRFEVMVSTTPLEPGVFGIIRPALLFPAGLDHYLTDAQLDAILAHEVHHVERRDNLVSAIHTLVEALFWFHPLVWIIGSRLVIEREQACDEEVLRTGSDPVSYAEGIVRVCECYLRSPLPCAIGVTGGNLTRRIEKIMSPRRARKLDGAGKLLLAAAGTAAVIGPIVAGAVNAPRLQSQLLTSHGEAFDVASIRPSQRSKVGGEGRARENIDQSPTSLTLRNVTLSSCLQFAYGVKFYQISGPDWLKLERFDILAKAAAPASRGEMKRMLQTLLAERFKVALHRETKEQPVYALVVAKNGPRLRAANAEGDSDVRVSDGSFIFEHVSMPDFAEKLADLRTIDRPVVDRTGIPGVFDVTLKQAASAMLQDDGPSIFTLLQEQLGLRLEPQRGAIDILVIDHAARAPTGN